MKKLIFLKSFESFHPLEFEKLQKLNKTYIRRKFRENIERPEEYEKLITKIRNYDVNKFHYKEYPYGIYIVPDEKFFNIIIEINKFIENEIPLGFDFTFSIDKNQLNLIDFTEGIYEPLRGFGLGYKLYKLIISKFEYITSNRFSSIDAYNIWYNLMLDEELYCFTSNLNSGVIHKKASNNIIKYVIDNLENKENIEFDNELEQKIIEIYGSLDIYTQKI